MRILSTVEDDDEEKDKDEESLRLERWAEKRKWGEFVDPGSDEDDDFDPARPATEPKVSRRKVRF